MFNMGRRHSTQFFYSSKCAEISYILDFVLFSFPSVATFNKQFFKMKNLRAKVKDVAKTPRNILYFTNFPLKTFEQTFCFWA